MPQSASLEIHVMNVGQGDSVLVINRALGAVAAAITTNKGATSVPPDPIDYVPYALANGVPLTGTVTRALLVDGGDDEYGGDVLNYMTAHGVLDGTTVYRPDLALVVSHYHDDHMAGLRSVFKERIDPKKKGDKVRLVERLRPGTVYQAVTDTKSDPTSQRYADFQQDVIDAMAAPVNKTVTPPITIMDMPRITQASYAANVVSVDWMASIVPGAAYDIALQPDPLGGAGFQVPGPPGAPAPTAAQIDMTGRPRWMYSVRVRARTPGSTGDWGMPAEIGVLDPPTGLAVSYAGTVVTASWNPVSGQVTTYTLTLRNPDGTVSNTWPVSAPPNTTAPPPATFAFPAGAIAPGVAYTLTVLTHAGLANSAQSAPVPVELLGTPTGVTAAGNVTGTPSVQVSWTPVNGAGQYEVRVANAAGAVVFDQTGLTATSVNCTGPLIVANASYTVTVTASAGTQGTTSPPAAVTIPALYTCLCLGTPPGRTGWVAVPPGSGGEVAVLAQLAVRLAEKGILSATDPFDIFLDSQPFQVRDTGSGGPFTCLCLGVTPGTGCGNDGIGDDFTGVFVNASQADLDNEFHPTRTPSRTGWVSVSNAAYLPLEVLLQLVSLLSQAGRLTGDEPYDVFNQSMSVRISTVGEGPATCVALGAPLGGNTTTKGGRFGDVVVGVAPADLPGYQPGPASGWATIAQQPYSVYSATLKLVTLLAEKNILTGTQPYDIFNNATAWRVIGG